MAPSLDPSLCTHDHSIFHDPATAIEACTVCGTVLESSSSTGLQVLGRVLEDEEELAGRTRIYEASGSYVGRMGRGLDAGEGKGLVYHEKRKAESEQFIRKLLTYFRINGLFHRSKTLFAEAKRIGKFKWGPVARVIAVACVYIAIRERDKPVRLEELAGVSDVDYVTLTRAQFTVKYWLKIKTHEVDPVIFLERPIIHLSELFSASANPRLSGNSKKTTWGKKNLDFIRSIDLGKVRQLATGLLAFSAELQLSAGRAPEAVAVAAVVVAIEGVARTRAPAAQEFFDELGHLLGVKPYTVSERYREFGKVLADYAPRLPWLSADASVVKGKKGAKKETMAHTMDIVQFRKSLERAEERKRREEREEQIARGPEGHKSLEELKKEEGEEEYDDDDGEEERSDVEWDDEEGEEDPPGGPPSFFADPLVRNKAAAASLRAGDVADSSTGAPAVAMTWSQLATSFNERKISAGATTKRPAAYMRQRPGPVKRVKTIENAAQSLLSSFGAGGQTTTPSPAPEGGVPSSAGPSHSPAFRSAASPHLSLSPRSRSTSQPAPVSCIAPVTALPVPSRATPFAAHTEEAMQFRQLLLAGHAPSSIFEGSVEYEPSASLRSTRLATLLWHKTAEEVEDDELFDQGELEGIMRSEEEVRELERLEKWREMPQAKPWVEPKGGKRVKRQARTRVLRYDGTTLEEDEEAERKEAEEEARKAGDGRFGVGGVRTGSRRTKVSQEMKEKLARLLGPSMSDGEEGDDDEVQELLNLQMAAEVAVDEGEEGEGLESEDDE